MSVKNRKIEVFTDTYKKYTDTRTALFRVLDECPFLARCSDDKTATRIRPREYAIRYPYMQINRPGMVSWLIFDLDHTNAMVWQDVGLPAPNLIVSNRASGHSHLFYAIVPVCTSKSARPKPIAYMKGIYAAFALRLNADINFHSGPVAKTPGHPWWLTHELHNHVYELGQLADHVVLANDCRFGKKPKELDEINSRHCLLFEQLRHYAYSIVNNQKENGSFLLFHRLLESFAKTKNNFGKQGFIHDLKESSIKATVKSVARWTWDFYTGRGDCHRGVMRLDKSLTLELKQQAAAKYTHLNRRKKTEERIRAACLQILQLGGALTFVAIAKVSGMTRQTVSAYQYVRNELLKAPENRNNDSRPSRLHALTSVNYAVHQVSAALSEGALDDLQCSLSRRLSIFDG